MLQLVRDHKSAIRCLRYGFDQIGQHKNFAQGPEGQGILVKRKVLGAVGQTKAKIAEAFKVHEVDSYLWGLNIVYVFWNLLGAPRR